MTVGHTARKSVRAFAERGERKSAGHSDGSLADVVAEAAADAAEVALVLALDDAIVERLVAAVSGGRDSMGDVVGGEVDDASWSGTSSARRV